MVVNEVGLARGDHFAQGQVPAYPQGSHDGASGVSDVCHDVMAELCSALFASLRRSDQRRRAEQYLRGLLSANGRKSMRNIATLVGGPAAEQSLHHFISSSTWDWLPMREALARFLERVHPPQAWVVQSLPIPKAGRHSVGVAHQFVPELGQAMNGQQAYGVWFASATLSAPVSWRLFLPGTWVNDRARRRRAEIPEEAGEETLAECVAASVLDAVAGWSVARRPVVFDARATGVRAAARWFTAAGVPWLTRTAPTARLVVADPALPGYGGGPIPALRILESVKGLRRPVEWTDPVTGVTHRSSVAGIRVALPPGAGQPGQPGRVRPGSGGRALTLLGEWPNASRAPAQLWLTDMAATPSSSLLRMTKLPRRVAHDCAEIGDRVGLRDFEGRSFRGWHRHMTLASAAHTASLLAGSEWSAEYRPAPHWAAAQATQEWRMADYVPELSA